MKKVIIPAFALLVFSAVASAQQEGISTAANKTVIHKPAGNTASVTPKKTRTSVTVTKAGTTTKTATIKRKHRHHHKPGKGKSKM